MLDYSKIMAVLCKCCIGKDSVLWHTLSVLLGMIDDNPERAAEAWSQIPKNNQVLKRAVEKKVGDINRYFRNVRFTGLSRTTALWGVLINALKVAGESKNVTNLQKEIFSFPEKEVLEFFQLLIQNTPLCREIHKACDQPSSDLRTLGAVVMATQLTEANLTAIVQFINDEGPIDLDGYPDEVMQAIDPEHLGVPGSTQSFAGGRRY